MVEGPGTARSGPGTPRSGTTRATTSTTSTTSTAVVALDLLGGDDAPGAVVDGALLALDADPHLSVVLVGPPDVAAAALAERAATGRCDVVPATQVVGMEEDPARGVRAKRDATVRVAARLVRDGHADATVSLGSTGAAMAAALFTLGRLPGVSRPPLAAVVPGLHGPVVLLDCGAGVAAGPELLAQYALVGTAYAQVRLGLPSPRVGLLSVGEEPGKGDDTRKDAYARIGDLPVDFVGNVEGGDVPLGGRADVVVTDGFTGNVLLKGLEGAHRLLVEVLGEAAREATADRDPEGLGGAVLLGVDGVAVVGHGGSTPRAVAACVRSAAQAAREGLVPRTAEVLAALVARRAEQRRPEPRDPRSDEGVPA